MRILTFTGGVFAENGYIAVCRTTGDAVVVDPGAAAPRMAETIGDERLRVTAILLTHAHLDHIEGLPAILEVAAAPVHLHTADRPLYDAVQQQGAAFGVTVPPLPPPDRTWEHGDTVEFGTCSLSVRHAPGHVILWEEEHATAFVGDVVFQGSIGRTDLPGGDYRQLMGSIRDQVLTLPDDTRLLTGHGPETTVAHERRGNPFLVPQYGGELA